MGLVWAGNPTFADDRHRSSSLEKMQVLTEVAGIDFFALQMPLKEGDAKLIEKNAIHSLESELLSYAHTAAFIEQLDLVICTCTSVAHLAAGLGKPTWIVLSTFADWRWGIEGETSAWYPTMRLFRQQREGDWDQVFARVKQALQQKWQG